MKRLKEVGVSYGHTPFDARIGHGYGRLDPKPSFLSQQQKYQNLYPYAEDSLLLQDLYPEIFDDIEGNEYVDDKFIDKFSSKMNMNRADIDHHAIRMNVRDRESFVSSRFQLAWHIRDGISLKETFFNPSGKSNPNAPRVSGTTRGWAAPPVGLEWDDDDLSYSLKDIADNAEENDEIKTKKTPFSVTNALK